MPKRFIVRLLKMLTFIGLRLIERIIFSESEEKYSFCLAFHHGRILGCIALLLSKSAKVGVQ
jgi:hypothetical protein